MKRLTSLAIVAIVFFTLAIVRTFAQSATANWPFFAEVTPGPGTYNTYDVLVPLQVMDQSQDELGDLRLFDATGKEIPYALRVRREIDNVEEFSGSLFNYAQVGNGASEVSVDLGENPGEHNEVRIQTAGRNFRRRVNLEGSDNGKDWKTLTTDAVIFGFEAAGRAAESNRVSYPASRFRYLRVRVFADEMTDGHSAPVITNVIASRAVQVQGELASWNVPVPSYESQRNQGVPTTAWTLDLGGRAACDRLSVEVDADSFSRPFQLEVVDDPQNRRLIASGDLVRRLGEEHRPLVIKFDQEEHARKLRLLVSDYSNQALQISGITASAPARQLVFQLKQKSEKPLRLYFGNYSAVPPHYDFEKDLNAKPDQTIRSSIGSYVPNPDYKPAPLPITERIPWLIYLVLAASSVALGLILVSLARSTLGSGPPVVEQASEPASHD